MKLTVASVLLASLSVSHSFVIPHKNGIVTSSSSTLLKSGYLDSLSNQGQPQQTPPPSYSPPPPAVPQPPAAYQQTPPPPAVQSVAPVVPPPVQTQPVQTQPTPVAVAGTADPTQAISTLQQSQTLTVDKIAAAIPDLSPKTDLSFQNASIDNSPASLDGRDAPGPANIAWLANVNVDSKLSSLTIFNGPLTSVPHLLSRVVVKDSMMEFTLDFRPRAYGAYELKDAAGNYPGPDTLGRAAFEYSGNRKEFESDFGTEMVVNDIQAFCNSLEGATVNTTPDNEFEQKTTGPLYHCITMPCTAGNVEAVKNIREKIANYWLQWALEEDHDHRPGAPINSQYVYDTKFRQNAFAALLPVYQGVFGTEDGKSLALAESGPLDEAYVGGGS
ncbi:hypothetical protein CTEN210_12037 [Chaetoceros tenuissimus]|uniref:Phospholipase B-like n=1 Tax=Chaetoceros tenuissimus TaxID=426638 RepID=A0AAD3H9V6_9STRA|nr:hypothetical protein CTEN210_12037 [Chaetoceros tenuissimus]